MSAIALGAAAGVQESAATAVKDAYQALKRFISERYQSVDVSPVERRPESEAKRDSLAEDLDAAGAGADAELLDMARQLIDQVKNHRPAAGPAVGIDLEQIEAAALNIDTVEASGAGVRVHHGKFTGDITIANVRAGTEPPDHP
ncbi:hypothetical protein [Streptomyces sp.]|uniref:hypothetical protein n=1 Tax=Streptomyces sp. TaxID=1931 RepID=UPI002D79B95C|nr:hypothetical protein [Streptomyces sp.]HET6355446.1 hypothetical protein [Streptomyces sp.]